MNVLLVQSSFLGDTILSTPVIAGIKRIHPGCSLSVLTTPLAKELLKYDPLIDEIITFDKRHSQRGICGILEMARTLRKRKFEHSYLLQRSYRTAFLALAAGLKDTTGFTQAALSFAFSRSVRRNADQHDVMRNLSILSRDLPLTELDPSLRLFPPPIEACSSNVQDLLTQNCRLAVLGPGSAWATKMWNKRHYRSVAAELAGRGLKVVTVGSASEAQICEEVCSGLDAINLAGKASIGDTIAIVRAAQLVLCNDSALLHMASAFKRPTVVVFCSTSPSFGFGPWQSPALVVEHQNLSCKPCGRHGHRRCPLRTNACMEQVLPSEVLAAIDKVLSGIAIA